MKKFIASVLALSLTGGFFIFPEKIEADGPSVLISEVCTDPQADWSTNNFNGVAASGSITDSDEFIEIVNVSSQTVNLTGWTIKFTDSQVDVDEIDASLVKNENPEGDVTQFPSGYYYILGNPLGSMNNDVKVELSDSSGNLIDSVTLGNFDDGNPDDNAPNGNAASVDDEVVARNYNNQDTGVDKNDFQKTNQTMGQINPEWDETTNEPEPEPETPNPENEPNNENNQTGIEYSDQIRLSEIMPDPVGSDTENEFIELFNDSDQAVDLADWLLGDASNRTYKIKKDDFETTVIGAKSYLVIYRKKSGIALNNSGDKVVLYQPDQKVLEEVEYGKSAEGQSYVRINNEWNWTTAVTPGQPNSYKASNQLPEAKITASQKEANVRQNILLSASGSEDPDGDDLTFAWDLGDGSKKEGMEIEHLYLQEGEFKIILTVTDKMGATDQAELLITVADYDYSEKILINELLPNPEEDDKNNEWIELVNFSNEKVNLAGWKLTDKKTDYLWSTDSLIEPQGFLVVERTISKIGLNNSGDEIFLVDPANKVINGVKYPSAKSGLSFARVDEKNWQWTETATPGKANQIALTVEEEENNEGEASSGQEIITGLSIDQIKLLNSGDLVVVQGVVVAEPGILGKNIFYIMDEKAGIQINCLADCPEVILNDEVSISGKISVSKEQRKIKANKADISNIGQKEIVPPLVAMADLEKYLDSLVKIEGQVASVETNNIYLTDEWGQSGVVYLKRSTGLKKSFFSEGQKITVTGIVELNEGTARLLPRSEEDVAVSGEVLGATSEETPNNNEIALAEPEKSKNYWPYIVAIIVLAGGGGYYFWWRKRSELS